VGGDESSIATCKLVHQKLGEMGMVSPVESHERPDAKYFAGGMHFSEETTVRKPPSHSLPIQTGFEPSTRILLL